MGYSTTINRAPLSTATPSATTTSTTLPALGRFSSFSIFIASTITSPCPTWTSCPSEANSFTTLPGIGAYTAAAVAAIAFGRPAVVLDGNIERVMARLFQVEIPLPDAKPILRAHAETLPPQLRPGDYAQAVMDLGATVCTPRKPRCLLCPWRAACAAFAQGQPERLPLKRPKPERPVRHGVAFWLSRPDGTVLLRRRAERGTASPRRKGAFFRSTVPAAAS